MKEKEIIEIAKNYILNSKNNNALFINGTWGSGKTYFVKNKLSQEIEKLEFKVIYVSLNGIKSNEELKSLVFSQSIVQGLFKERKTVTDFTNRFSKIFAESTIMKIMKPSDFIILDKVLVCFDDVERISSSFKIEDALGCINSEYVEHKGIKVILIGDETKNQLEQDTYKKVKEKLIGWTVDYEHELKESLLSIKNIWKNDSFKTIFDQYFDFIFETIEAIKCQNLRSVIFALDCLSKISSVTQKTGIDTLKEIIYFTFCISKEYKRGAISNNLETDSHIKKTGNRFDGWMNPRLFSPDSTSEKIEPDKDDFRVLQWNKHLESNQITYRYFESIFKFITTGYFNEIEFQKDIEAHDTEKEKKKTNENDALVNNLGGFPNLTNEEFTEKIELSLHKLQLNDFSLYHFLLLCRNLHILQSYKLIEMSKEELNTIFLTHYDAALLKAKKNETSHIERFFPDIKNYNENLSIELKSRWEAHLHQLETAYFTNLFETWDFNGSSGISFNQFIQNVNVDKIANEIIKKIEKRDYVSSVLYSIQQAYNSVNCGEHYYFEKEKLIELASLLENLANEANFIFIDRYIIDEIITALNKAAEHLESTRKS
jgi:DNA helicase HerA-like ATPase